MGREWHRAKEVWCTSPLVDWQVYSSADREEIRLQGASWIVPGSQIHHGTPMANKKNSQVHNKLWVEPVAYSGKEPSYGTRVSQLLMELRRRGELRHKWYEAQVVQGTSCVWVTSLHTS